ncbi:MAG: AMP-binding protein [Acidimicrobiia bacterium]|nr:AMP-binding protein [Acidimicrobiia bacterium]MCY4433542.1 AMP-binding protein [bacterium]
MSPTADPVQNGLLAHTPSSFADVWARSVDRRSDSVFLVFERPDGGVATWTYEQFDAAVSDVAAGLIQREVAPGSSVHLALTNTPAFVALWLAASRLGAWIVPSDPMGKVPELADHIERTRPQAGFCAADRAGVYRQAAAGRPDMVITEVDEASASLDALTGSARVDWPEVDPRDRSAVMFTSGTTGRPKGVEITQANYAFCGQVMAERADLTPDDRQLVVLPLFHANAQYYSFASAIWTGASVALMPAFSASGFLAQAARHQATCASLFAAPMRMILARGNPVDGVALRHCWYAQNIADDQYETLSQWLGCRPRQLYGMTETIPAVLTEPADNPVPSSMGQVTPGCQVIVRDGEVLVGGEPGTTLFAGYLDDPETTAASFTDDGWFRTGDRASVDPDGRHYFDGRHSDVLKVAGENVSIVEVESVLASHPAVLEAAVVGAPDPVRDEVPVAFVVAADPASPPAAEELSAWCNQRLTKAKLPRSFTLIDELPRTSVGKIRKFLLRQEAEAPKEATGR